MLSQQSTFIIQMYVHKHVLAYQQMSCLRFINLSISLPANLQGLLTRSLMEILKELQFNKWNSNFIKFV